MSENPLVVNKLFVVGSDVTITVYVSDAAGSERVNVTSASIVSIMRGSTEVLASPIVMVNGGVGVYSATFSTDGWTAGIHDYVVTLISSGGKSQSVIDQFVLRALPG